MKFICTKCGNQWSANKNSKTIKGYINPPCPVCGAPSVDSANHGDFVCHSCGKHFRRYGNGGLKFGMIPKCPNCGSNLTDYDK